ERARETASSIVLVACRLVSADIRYLFFINDTATTEIYTLSLHDALPIWGSTSARPVRLTDRPWPARRHRRSGRAPILFPSTLDQDRKSTRLNSSHVAISYAVFCLKKIINQVRTILSETVPEPSQSPASET